MQDTRLQAVLAEQPYPLLFVTLSESHLYGFASPNSDYDLRGVHVLPVREVIGLHEYKETIDFIHMHSGLEIDLVTHDVRKFFKLLLGKNGNALECIYSPFVIYTTPEHDELKALAMCGVTRAYGSHYLGFATSQLKLFNKEAPRRVKSLLYVYRVILTGLHLLRTGQLEPNLVRLNEVFQLASIPDLIACKQSGAEHAALKTANLALYEAEITHLLGLLEDSITEERSTLPKEPDPHVQKALNDLLLRLRLKSI